MKYTFCEAPLAGTGQYSYTDDPATPASEGFGLMFYVSRWYDPSLGRFIQADTLIPGGAQGLDRYAYVNNAPTRFTDPSGHRCFPENECVGPNGQGEPDYVDFSQLSQANPNRKYSGWMMYSLYLAAWEAKGGYLTIKQFTTYMLGHEFEPYDKLDEDFITILKTAAGNWFWCSPNADTNGCTNLRENGGATNAAMLNWIGGMESARRRFDNFKSGADAWEQVSGGPKNLPLATDVLNFVLYESTANGHLYLDQPFYWANYSLPLGDGILSASQGWQYNQYWAIYPDNTDSNPAYILSPCQTAYWRGDID